MLLVLALMLLLIMMPGAFNPFLTSEAASSTATVIERQGQSYDATIVPGQRATFKWDLLNPTNTTWEFTVVVMSENPDLRGTMDRDKVQVFAGQTDTVVLKVSSEASETTSAKLTLVFTIRNLSTDENLTAYKTAEVHFVVTHGVDFHGLFTLQPSWLHLDDNDYTRLLMIVLFYLLMAVLAIAVIIPVAGLVVSRTKTKIDDVILQTVRKPIFFLILLYGLLDAIAIVKFIPSNLAKAFDVLFGVGVMLVILYMAYKLLDGVLGELRKEFKQRTKTDVGDIIFSVVEKVGIVLIVVFGIMGLLYYFGIDVTVLAAGLGVASLVVAFAAQDSISNFFSGIIILLDRPFKMGDVILIDNDFSRVLHIGLRSTKVYNIFQHTVTVIPNNALANSKVTNLSAPDSQMRVKVYWDAPYGIDTEMFTKLMVDTVEGSPKKLGIIKGDPKRAIWCLLNEMKGSAIQFVIGFWVSDLMDQWDAAAYVRTQIYKECMKRKVEIPFPQMDVHIKDAPKDVKG
jgi:small-conductance mechanosensitive channel